MPAQPRAELESIQRTVSEEASVISADALPEIDPPAETGLQLVSDWSREREQSPALPAGDNVEPLSSMQILSRLASHAQLFRSSDGRLCARVPVGDRLEIYGLKSAGFRDWLIAEFLIYQPLPPSSWAIGRAVAMLEAKARFNTGIPDVFVRVGQDGDDGESPYFSTWAIPAAGPSSFAINVGASSIGPTSTFVVSKGFGRCLCRFTTVRSIYCARTSTSPSRIMELRRIASQLRLHGLAINFERKRGERIVTLSSDGPNNTSQPSTTLPQT